MLRVLLHTFWHVLQTASEYSGHSVCYSTHRAILQACHRNKAEKAISHYFTPSIYIWLPQRTASQRNTMQEMRAWQKHKQNTYIRCCCCSFPACPGQSCGWCHGSAACCFRPWQQWQAFQLMVKVAYCPKGNMGKGVTRSQQGWNVLVFWQEAWVMRWITIVAHLWSLPARLIADWGLPEVMSQSVEILFLFCQLIWT